MQNTNFSVVLGDGEWVTGTGRSGLKISRFYLQWRSVASFTHFQRGGTKYSISVDRTRLVIVNVNRNEASVFSCVVENEAGRTDARFSINVLGKYVCV